MERTFRLVGQLSFESWRVCIDGAPGVIAISIDGAEPEPLSRIVTDLYTQRKADFHSQVFVGVFDHKPDDDADSQLVTLRLSGTEHTGMPIGGWEVHENKIVYRDVLVIRRFDSHVMRNYDLMSDLVIPAMQEKWIEIQILSDIWYS